MKSSIITVFSVNKLPDIQIHSLLCSEGQPKKGYDKDSKQITTQPGLFSGSETMVTSFSLVKIRQLFVLLNILPDLLVCCCVVLLKEVASLICVRQLDTGDQRT